MLRLRLLLMLLLFSLSGARAVQAQSTTPEVDPGVESRPGPDPARAALLSAVVPGAGQIYSMRPAPGLAFLGGSAGLLAFGLLSERVTVECLERTTGSCPVEQVLSESRERHQLTPALVGLAGLAIAGTIEAYYGAREKRRRSEGERSRAVVRPSAALLPPAVEVTGSELRLQIVRVAIAP